MHAENIAHPWAFDCRVEGSSKLASLCGAGYDEASQSAGYLQYRYGPPGKPEMLFPAVLSKEAMQDRFIFSATRSHEYDRYDLELQFRDKDTVYSLHSVEKRRDGPTQYAAHISLRKLASPCVSRCPAHAPFATPKYQAVKVLTCANRNAGAELYPNAVVRLLTTPGRSSANKY